MPKAEGRIGSPGVCRRRAGPVHTYFQPSGSAPRCPADAVFACLPACRATSRRGKAALEHAGGAGRRARPRRSDALVRLTVSRTVSLRIASCMAWMDARPAPARTKRFAFLHPLPPRWYWWAGMPLPYSMPRAAPASCRRMRVSFGTRSGLRFSRSQKPTPHEQWREPAMSALGYAASAARTRLAAQHPPGMLNWPRPTRARLISMGSAPRAYAS